MHAKWSKCKREAQGGGAREASYPYSVKLRFWTGVQFFHGSTCAFNNQIKILEKQQSCKENGNSSQVEMLPVLLSLLFFNWPFRSE